MGIGEYLYTKDLGVSIKKDIDLERYTEEKSGNEYDGSKYDLFKRNCNNFTNALANFLTNDKISIPQHILDLPTRMSEK